METGADVDIPSPDQYANDHIYSQQKIGRAIQDGSNYPVIPTEKTRFNVESRQKLINALLGAASGIQASRKLGGRYSPVASAIVGGAAGIGVPAQQEAIQREAQAQEAQLQLQQFEAMPIEQLSPGIIEHHPELAGLPFKYAMPIVEKYQAMAQKELTPVEIKVLDKIQNGQQLNPEDLKGVRESVVSAAQMTNIRKSRSDPKRWEQLNRVTNPTVAPRGSLLGQAGIANSRADRALAEIAKNPNSITPQLKKLIELDIAGVMQGGAPHAEEIRATGFGTLLDDFANLKTRLTGNPGKAEIPKIIAELKGVLTTLKEVDNTIIRNNLESAEAGPYADLIAADPDRWDKYKNSVLKMTGGPAEVNTIEKRMKSGKIGLYDAAGNFLRYK